MARPTMEDVAARAGVSPKTVSNVVRGWPAVRPETERRVRDAIAETGYRINLAPRVMRTGRSDAIALAVPWLDSPYFSELTSAIVRAAAATGLSVHVKQTDGAPERERAVLKELDEIQVDGFIFSPSGLGEPDLPSSFGVPTVLLGERIGSSRGDHVAIDNVAAALDAVTHLVGVGRRRVAAIGLQSGGESTNAYQRQRGYLLALRAAGLSPESALQVSVTAFSRAEGARAVRELLASGILFDAVFCFNDLLALGAMHELQRSGVRVPDDVAVAGFDDIEEGRFATPTLTTIRPDKAQIAAVALSLLSDRIGGDDSPAREVTLDYELVIRSSSSG
ncbi:DNA-binding LacI/PurR family transcriptional regulator [Salinibacterium sp. CAN_S4]|uniref:LacI family DNA-binding transcriptional regulator n=1 Tax=Salinibacterium sp. CAN_S4 TaxID=2787727 RepID=UPI0018F0029A